MKRALFAAAAGVLLAGCGTQSPSFEIDNPSSEPVQVTIDGTTHDVAAHSAVAVKLDAGQHTLDAPRTGALRFSVCGTERGTLINPTLADYLLVREVYVTDASQLQNFGAAPSTVELGGMRWEGPFEQYSGLFVDRTWDYDVRASFPQVQTVARVPEAGGRISTKLFTPADFIAYIEDASDSVGEFARLHPEGFVQPEHAVVTAPAQLPALPDAYEAHAAPLRDVYARRLQVTEAADCKAVRKQSHAAVVAFVGETATLGSTHSIEDNEAADTFMRTYSELLHAGALILP